MSDATPTQLSLDAGQLLVAGFQGATDAPPEAIRDALAAGRIGGVILFRRNVSEEISQVVALCEAIHEAARAHPVPFVSLDQEGGRVVRLRAPLSVLPPMRQVGAAASAELASLLSEVVATEIGALGFNLNFAPVLDVDTNPQNPVIGDRAFSHDPERVARMAGAWLVGHLISGVIPCGKHFPGHGDTLQDSHLALPTITHDRRRLDTVELLPFRRMIRAQIPMLMTAHIVMTELDPIYPATLSEAVIAGLLRRELGYQGVVVSDCVEMKAVADLFEIEEIVERGVRAGVDLFLISHTQEKWERAHAHLISVAERDSAFAAQLAASAARVRALKKGSLGRLAHPWQRQPAWRELLGCAAHRATLDRLTAAQAAHTMATLTGGSAPDPTEA